MKKLFSFVLAIVMVLTFSVSAMAAGVEFVPSISNKGAPDIVTTPDDGGSGKNIVGYIRNGKREILSTEYEDCLIITSIADAKDSAEISDAAKNELLNVYKELNKTDVKLSELCPELNDLAAKGLGAGKNADDLVVKDLFDISEMCDDLKTHLPKDDTYMDIKFNLGIPGDTYVVAMVYVDGKWTPLSSTTNNGDGTITCRFDNICPVAILVPADVQADTDTESDSDSSSNTDVPVTGDNSQNQLVLWISIMAVSLCALSVVAVIFFKKKKQ